MARKLSDYPKGIKRKWDRYQRQKENQRILTQYAGEGIYYVMNPHIEECGIATTIRCVLSHAKHAKEQGYKLVMDYRSRKNPYLLTEEVGKINAWEYFFEQPSGVTLDEIAGKDNVFVTEENQLSICPTDSMEFYTNEYAVTYWRGLYHEYIRLSEEAKSFIEKQRIKVFGENPYELQKKVLGCVVRGTDYIQGRPLNHPVQPLPEEVLEKAKKTMEEKGYEYLFLATEDENVLKLFQQELKDKLLYVEQQRYTDGTTLLALQPGYASESSPKLEGLKYLSVIYLLAECDGLIGGRCGITTIAYLISKGFSYTYLWNLGRYHTDDYCLPQKYR